MILEETIMQLIKAGYSIRFEPHVFDSKPDELCVASRIVDRTGHEWARAYPAETDFLLLMRRGLESWMREHSPTESHAGK